MWYDDYLSDFNEDFIKNYSEDGEKRYFLEVDIEYPEELWSSHKDLPFLAERRKLEKVEKLIVVQKTKKNVIHISTLKQALNNGLTLKKVHRVIKLQQKAWLKLYIVMNMKRKDAKSELENDFFKLMNISVFGKAIENVREHRDI